MKNIRFLPIVYALLVTSCHAQETTKQKEQKNHPEHSTTQSAEILPAYIKLWRETLVIDKIINDARTKISPESNLLHGRLNGWHNAWQSNPHLAGLPPSFSPVSEHWRKELVKIKEKINAIDYSGIDKIVVDAHMEYMKDVVNSENARIKTLDAFTEIHFAFFENVGTKSLDVALVKEKLENASKLQDEYRIVIAGKDLFEKFIDTFFAAIMPKAKKGKEWVPFRIALFKDAEVEEWTNNTSEGKEWLNSWQALTKLIQKIDDEVGANESKQRADKLHERGP